MNNYSKNQGLDPPGVNKHRCGVFLGGYCSGSFVNIPKHPLLKKINISIEF